MTATFTALSKSFVNRFRNPKKRPNVISNAVSASTPTLVDMDNENVNDKGHVGQSDTPYQNFSANYVFLPGRTSAEKHSTPTFTTLPLKIRQRIYKYLLTTSATINKPGTLAQLKSRFAIGLTDRPNLEIAVLSTCHQVYDEALPVLYDLNAFAFAFAFYGSKDVEAFRSKGLAMAKMRNPLDTFYVDIPTFGFKANPQGRLALLIMVDIHFLDDKFGNKDIMRHWEPCFKASWILSYELRFPAVEDLRLDFVPLNLGMKGLKPSPIVRKFKEVQGLRRLEIAGVQHIATLDRLRKGLVRESGQFIISENW
ncbi:MAG: hypothetical protein Q9209_007870, partial [Squamulea sp. 1 TL-2023]